MIKHNRLILALGILLLGLLFASKDAMMNANAQTKDNKNLIHYTIKKDDTFFLLAKRFNSGVDEIVALNPNEDPTNLQIGSQVKIPVGYGKVIHYVKKGDRLGTIANDYRTTVQLLTDTNYIKNPELIYPGEIVAIPKIDDFPIEKFKEKFTQAYERPLNKTNIRIEHGVLKMDNILANLAGSMYTSRITRETLDQLGYRVINEHTIQNIKCDYRLCFGTKLFTIGKAN